MQSLLRHEAIGNVTAVVSAASGRGLSSRPSRRRSRPPCLPRPEGKVPCLAAAAAKTEIVLRRVGKGRVRIMRAGRWNGSVCLQRLLCRTTA
jgi:hypothetical protein